MARKQMLCDECIDIISENLSTDQILILQYLKKENTINMNLSKDKTSIMPNVKGMTEFKFQSAISGLELCNFVKRNANKRPNKFFITKDGIKALEIYQNNIREELSGGNEE